MSQSGRPLSGFIRPGTQSARPGTMEQALRSSRTAGGTARWVFWRNKRAFSKALSGLYDLIRILLVAY